MGIPLRDLPAWKIFIEITERRNLFVHADGVVNKQYLEECKSVGYEIEEDVVIGSKLIVTPEYYKSACDCITEIGVKLAQVMWRKLLPSKNEKADISLITVTYDLLSNRDYQLALTLCEFNDLPAIKNSCLENTYYLKVNQAIALKGLESQEQVKQILDSFDFSILSKKFKIAAAVLIDDWEEAAKLMIKIGSKGNVTKQYYREWPLFRWFRKTDEFKSAFEEVFGEEFKIIGKAVPDENTDNYDDSIDSSESHNGKPSLNQAHEKDSKQSKAKAKDEK